LAPEDPLIWWLSSNAREIPAETERTVPTRDELQIPESEQGAVLASASVDKSRVANQAGGYRKTFVMGCVGVVAGIVFIVISPDNPMGGIVVLAIFGFLLLGASWRWWTSRILQEADEKDLVAYQVREGGLLIPTNFFIPWDEITGVTYEWRSAGGGVAVGVAGLVAKKAYDGAMAAHELDNARRVINVNLGDYKKTNARNGGMYSGMITGPFLGFPGSGTVNLSGTVNDAQFQELLTVTEREALARGKTFAKHDPDAEGEAARAKRRSKKS
jgi:hypothetical protein